jgi:hypothetical protein
MTLENTFILKRRASISLSPRLRRSSAICAAEMGARHVAIAAAIAATALKDAAITLGLAQVLSNRRLPLAPEYDL